MKAATVDVRNQRNQRVQASASRAIDSSRRLQRISEQMIEELDEVTPPIGVPIRDLPDDDSAVIAMVDAITANGGTPKRRARTEPGRDRDDDEPSR